VRNGSAALSLPVRLPPRTLRSLVLLGGLVLQTAAQAQVGPPATGGAERLDLLLQRLGESRRVLVIAAHPDDEDTGLLVLLSRGYGATSAYLSLSRGEGGQNLIGSELGVSLGLLRTEELLAARRMDGASQFFTRAYDFGFTRSLPETERFWLPDSILKDVVRVVRRFRPHVIVTVFSGTPRDGHGQHQMAGVMARRAFEAAADPRVFPELASDEGLSPWQPLKLYTSARFSPEAATLALPEGRLDPRTGRSFSQIAMDARSQHRSQDFGMLQRLGPSDARLTLERPVTPEVADTDIFSGVPPDSSWLRRLADSLRAVVTPEGLERAVAPLAAAVRRAASDRLVSPEMRQLLAEALAVAAGVVVDARAASSSLVPGEAVGLEAEVFNAGADSVRWIRAEVTPAVEGWPESLPLDGSPGTVPPGVALTRRANAVPPATARPTRPYFLERPLQGALYDWSGAAPAVRGLPMQPPPLTARFQLTVAGAPVELQREVTQRIQDQAFGEIRVPVRVVPKIEVQLEPDTLVWPAGGGTERTFIITLRHNGADTTAGNVSLTLNGWPAPPAQAFRLDRRGETQRFTFVVRRPAGVDLADATMRAVARTAAGEVFDGASEVVAYPHIWPTAWLRPATSRIRVAPIALPAGRRIGYVRGASDKVPEALARAGLPVELLGADALARGDLSRYDAIVIGSRAYETDTALVANNDRLLDYVRAGGRVLVQYQQYPYVRGGYAPFPLQIATPHDRVTDETAPVTLLEPGSRVFREPNAITNADWDGWPQERGLYFPRTWDPAYTPLLEMHDPDMPPLRGALLVAPYGRGTYIYTGLSFFRALPAGVPGAFRLFFNLLDLRGRGVP
jgi:LmbE family N-acetylglucosaminyl deacetylase